MPWILCDSSLRISNYPHMSPVSLKCATSGDDEGESWSEMNPILPAGQSDRTNFNLSKVQKKKRREFCWAAMLLNSFEAFRLLLVRALDSNSCVWAARDRQLQTETLRNSSTGLKDEKQHSELKASRRKKLNILNNWTLYKARRWHRAFSLGQAAVLSPGFIQCLVEVVWQCLTDENLLTTDNLTIGRTSLKTAWRAHFEPLIKNGAQKYNIRKQYFV